jgi:hypothetical protein
MLIELFKNFKAVTGSAKSSKSQSSSDSKTNGPTIRHQGAHRKALGDISNNNEDQLRQRQHDHLYSALDAFEDSDFEFDKVQMPDM